MFENKTVQENIEAGGNVAGRDNIQNNFSINSPAKSINYIERVTLRYHSEKANNPNICNIIDELQHFKTQIEGESVEVQGLKKKLTDGNLEDLIPKAEEYKEKFTKKLVKHEYSESAQEIFAYILAEVKTRFDLHVYPLLQQRVPIQQINQIIVDLVITPAQNELGDNVLRIYKDDINGMIFFLTGNCHIKWI
jgi:hypothetical protein